MCCVLSAGPLLDYESAMGFRRGWLGQGRALGWVVMATAGCALPSIHRDRAEATGQNVSKEPDAAINDAAADPVGDADAGQDPERDPANRNEDLATFQSLLPTEHRFAEWPMPDEAPQSKFKPSYTATDTVVTDNVTKLRWQRVMPKIYPGCTGRYSYVDRLHPKGSGCSWEEAQAYCRRPELAQQLGGGEWRVPTKIELESIVNVSRVNAVDPLFDDFPIDKVWTATPILNPDGLKLAWSIDFMEGFTMDSGRYSPGRVRCVSSPNAKGGNTPKYEAPGYNTVRDLNTQLEWQAAVDSTTRDWPEALAYCEALELEGRGWRLPLLKELLTLVDPSRRNAATYRKFFSLTQSERFWTASEALNARNAVFQVDFAVGGAHYSGTPKDKHYVRCVR